MAAAFGAQDLPVPLSRSRGGPHPPPAGPGTRRVTPQSRQLRKRAQTARGAGPRIARVTTLPDSILAADPPEHSRLRKLVTPAFTARRAEAMRSDVARLVDGLLDRLAAHDRPAGLVPLLARPLPLAVICDLLGVPRADGDRLDAWCDALRNLTATADAEVTTAVAEMTGYLTELVTAKRRRPGEHVLSTLIAARDEGDRLSQDELVSFALVLLAGGYGTTADRLAGSVHLLLDDPERWGQLVRAPAMIPPAPGIRIRCPPLRRGPDRARPAPRGSRRSRTPVPRTACRGTTPVEGRPQDQGPRSLPVAW